MRLSTQRYAVRAPGPLSGEGAPGAPYTSGKDLDAHPFARAEDNDGLNEIILGIYEEDHRERTERFSRELGIREDGTAAKQVADWLER